jgi:hypothetical protein
MNWVLPENISKLKNKNLCTKDNLINTYEKLQIGTRCVSPKATHNYIKNDNMKYDIYMTNDISIKESTILQNIFFCFVLLAWLNRES